ncbi:hypothetical protein LTR66_004254 [Elasticomyces elasticus]|nr:hypothetical protein LTR50_003219 [Elasticomyces elasticus]KAK4996058.1 hypothetical protein LTR66_004254 [Elasticomyces elasticus]
MSHPGRLENKIVLVTGGGFGIGAGIVQKFVEEGAKVLVVDINKDNGQKVADAQPKGSAIFCDADVTSEDDWARAVGMAVSEWGRLDIVVNNAGVVNKSTPSIEIAEDEYDRIMRINVKSVYHSSRAVVPQFRKQGGGVFVNISSISAPRPRPKLVWYAGSKGAVSAITKGLAAELAPDKIRVNAILPVAADTAMVPLVLGKEDTPENRLVVTKGIPLGRWATPRDIANAAAFLASDEAEFITGVCLPVDGGRSLN